MNPSSLSQRLAEIDGRLAAHPDHVELRYLRATLLAGLGRAQEAQQDYLAVIARAPTHFGALNDLGTLLYNTDYRGAARSAYAEAVKHHPENPIGRINLANALFADNQLDAAKAHYEAALSIEPDHPDAHQGLANVLQIQGELDAAEHHRRHSYRFRQITALPFRGEGPPCRVLLLVSGLEGNVPTRFLLDQTVFATSVLVVESFTAETAPPAHDIVFNAIGDADLCGAALDAAEMVLARTNAPVINSPARVRRTGRVAIAKGLAGVEGVVAPNIVLAPREALETAARGFGYPLLLRSPGYHTGRHFCRVERPEDLKTTADALPGPALLLIEPLDARDGAGVTRKYRVMFVGDEMFPLHLALSRDWKVHYFTADMAEQPTHRAEEAAFLENMPAVLGQRAMIALTGIRRRLGLDYAGVDFGLSPRGDVLLFEANPTMVVNPPDSDPRWDYRREPVDHILAATRAMLLGRSALGG